MSDITCPAGGHVAGSQPDTCTSCDFHNAFAEQLTHVLVNRAIDELPNSQENPLATQITKALVGQEITEILKRQKRHNA